MPNRLATQSSPYLLQHAHNPVDWYAWSDEAFAAARQRDVPVFLSIGYSTCYWCHVMERESFESQEIARLLNEAFVCIKVDREERPDIDDVYMAATTAMIGRGGWPMNVCLDPVSRKPFWCGTYFPPQAQRGMPGLPQVIEGISRAWQEQRPAVMEQAGQLADAVREQLSNGTPGAALDADVVAEAVSTLLRMSDMQHGGFGRAPKFPQPVFLDFLLEVRGSVDDDTRELLDRAVKLALDKMMLGGIRDHVGGGFHRYAVDGIWLVPHFEKMLYDQAQLAMVYSKAMEVYGDAEYGAVACEVGEYVLREMTDEQGLFYSAQDAEVDHREGLNYLWTPAEIMAALGEDDGLFAVKFYGLDQGANFKDPHHPSEPARNVLFRKRRGPADPQVRRVNEQLLKVRMQRKQPHLDDKVVASWNGLMIAALARTGRVLGEPKFAQAAARAMDALLALHRGSEDLLRVSRKGKAATKGFLEDYASVLVALHELDRAGSGKYAAITEQIRGEAERLFATGGTWHDTRQNDAELFLRTSSMLDGAMPSGTSLMLNALCDEAIAKRTLREVERVLSGLAGISGVLRQSPVALINSTRCLYRVLASGLDGVAERLANLGPATPPKGESEYPVEVYASEDRVELRADEPATFRIVLRIAAGYHILAAEPGAGATHMFPLRISVAEGTGVDVFADYPEGRPYGPDGELSVHTGEVEFEVVLERRGTWSGRPLLKAMFQACSDTECLSPRTVDLDVAMDKV